MLKALLVIGALDAAVAVILGAFGKHALEGRISQRHATAWGTATNYQLCHALAILLVALLAAQFSSSLLLAGWVLLVGSLLFSGSIYLLVLSGWTRLALITPLGGIALIAGWCILAWQLFHFL